MRKLLMTAALMLATATTAVAGQWNERIETDRVTGQRMYIATSYGQSLNPSWYADDNRDRPFFAVRCMQETKKAPPFGNGVTIALNFGNEVLHADWRDGLVTIDWNIGGQHVRTEMSDHHNGLTTAGIQLHKQRDGYYKFNPNAMTYLMFAQNGGPVIARGAAFARAGVDVQFNLTGFQSVFTKAANFCGMALRP